MNTAVQTTRSEPKLESSSASSRLESIKKKNEQKLNARKRQKGSRQFTARTSGAAISIENKSASAVEARRNAQRGRVGQNRGGAVKLNNSGGSLPVTSGGEPLSLPVRQNLERSFDIDLSSVRVHSNTNAQNMAGRLSARAFTVGSNIFLGAGESAADLGLMAHETTHVVQQQGASMVQMLSSGQGDSNEQEARQSSAAVMRGESFSIQGRTSGASVQRLGLSDILDGLADLAANVPGYTLLTVIIGRNPINQRIVERNFTNILRGFMGLIPGGEILFQVLSRYGVVERLGGWTSSQLGALGLSYQNIRSRFSEFVDSLGVRDIFSPSRVWQRAANLFTEPINQIRSFISRLISQAITWLKETFMEPLSNFCREIPGYGLVTVLLGRDPFTNVAVPRSAISVVRAFAEFIPGGTEKVNQLVESRALERAYGWFIEETQARNLTWARISGTFSEAWNSLRLEDVLHPVDTLRRMIGMFRPLMTDLVGFAGAALMKLLELIFEAVMGAGGSRVLAIVKRARSTFLIIVRNPVGFLRNLIGAVRQGVGQFSGNILNHLRAGVISWLTGPVARAGVQMPERWDARGIIWFVLQILGLTWTRVRQKLVRLMGERAVGMLETGFQLVQDIRQRGFVQALRERVTDFFGQLREAALGSIRSFIQQRMVMAGITQLLSLLNPVGAVIQAIIKTYTTVQFFLERMSQILEMVESIVNSVSAIASGAIGSAASFIERTMARTIPLILDFLARFIGLGDVGGHVQRTIQGLQARVDQMLDRAVDWIKAQAQRLGRFIVGGARRIGGRLAQWWRTRRNFRAADGQRHSLYFRGERRNARLYIASTPTPFEDFIRGLQVADASKQTAIRLAQQIDDFRNRTSPTDGALADSDLRRLEALWDPLAQEVSRLLGASTGPATPPQYGGTNPKGWGTSALVARKIGSERGTPPSEANAAFDSILQKRISGHAAKPGTRPYYKKGHLLSEHLGGPGEWKNMTPITQSCNTSMEPSERRIAYALHGKVLHFELIVRYGRSPNTSLLGRPEMQNPQSQQLQLRKQIIEAEQHVARSLSMRVFEVNSTGERAANGFNLTQEFSNTIDNQSLDDYVLAGQLPVQLKHISINDSLSKASQARHLDALNKLPGVGPTTRRKMIQHGPYTSMNEIKSLRGITDALVSSWATGVGGITVSLEGETRWE